MIKFMIIQGLLTLISFNLTHANEVGESSTAPTSSPRPRTSPLRQNQTPTTANPSSETPENPECIVVPENSNLSSDPEGTIKNLFQNLSDSEVHARLVMAEALASGPRCVGGTQRQGIYQGVAWVIANRMNNASGTYGRGRDAIFRNQQFRSSFGGCDVAQREAFLCPTSLGPDWASSWNLARTSVANTRRSENNPLTGVHHYYFGQHFNTSNNCARWKDVRPNWAVSSARRHPDITSLKADSDCLEFYEVR